MHMDAFANIIAPATVLIILCLNQDVEAQAKNQNNNQCDIFQGKWIYDAKYPLYSAKNCPFIESEFDCLKHGRPDKLYLKYKWKPTSCKLPRFNGTIFLERFRGKRIMFVGDSITLNQWQSLTCMLHLAVPKASYSLVRVGDVSTFSFKAYNVWIIYSRNGFLVDIVNETIGRVLKLNSIENGEIWKGVDTLIFDSWHWWLHTGKKQPWDYIQDSNHIYKDMNRLVAYEKALSTWAKWVNSNVDSSKTKVFYRGISPDHLNSSAWGNRNAKTCRGETQPVAEKSYPGGPHPAELVVEKVVKTI